MTINVDWYAHVEAPSNPLSDLANMACLLLVEIQVERHEGLDLGAVLVQVHEELNPLLGIGELLENMVLVI